MNTCGTKGEKVVVTPASSGRWRAASTNVRTFPARKAMSLPARSSSRKVTPPEVPTPGMAGGEKAKARAPGIRERAPLRRRLMASYFSSGALRSAQSWRVMKKKLL